jgi:phosphoglycerol transferase
MLDVPRPLAAIGALAYTWLPFHFLRTGHLFYTIYFVPPLVVAVAAQLADARLDPLRAWLTWPRVLLFIVAGTAGIYNAFFSIVVLCFTALVAAVAWREKRRLAHGIAAAAIVAAAALSTLAPSVIYQSQHGRNPDVSQRFAGESETYALKLAPLVLPNINHPIQWMRAPAGKYHSSGAAITENYTASLSLLGSAGFLLSLILLFGRFESPVTASGRRLDLLSKSNALLFLFATVGGLGATFAVLVSPQLRAWNRLSLTIAAVSLLVLLIALSRWTERASSPALMQRRVAVVTVVLAAIWLFDQAGWRMSQPAAARVEFRDDADFVAKAAALVPSGAMVYELPYVGYPEVKPLYAEDYYGMGRPYIHPSTLAELRGMRARERQWLRELSTRPVDEQIEAARRRIRRGLCRSSGLSDHGAQVEARRALRARLVVRTTARQPSSRPG